MMRWILGSSLKFRLLALPIAATILVLGVAHLRTMPVDVLPEFMPPSVEIQTEALGLAAAEVEQFVTVPMEQDLLNGVPWLQEIRSQSVPGLSSIDLTFVPGTDVLRARQVVQERLTQAVALPHVSKAPVMIQPESSTSRVMVVALSSKDMSLIDMSVLARWQIKPRLMGVPGVANVSIWGQRERQLQVQVDPDRLAQSSVTLNQVITTTGNALWVSPLSFVEASTPGTGGFVETPNQRLSIQHILPIRTAKDLAQVNLDGTSGATAKKLGDVTQVVEDHQPLIGDAVVGDGAGLILVAEKFPGANTLEVSRGVEAALRALQPGLSGVTIDTTVYKPATFIQSAIGNLRLVLLLGLILIVAVLGAFFFDWRAAIISVLAIPLSVVAALLVLDWRGSTINTLVLAGLVFALCVLIDDVVVNVDNIRRRLRERRAGSGPDSGKSLAATVVEACLEVRGPMMYATLVLLAAVVPLFFLAGVTGAFAQSLAISYVLAVLASTVVALTVTPALALVLFAKASPRRREAPLLRWLRRGYAAALARSIRGTRLGVAAAVVLIAAIPIVLPMLGGSLLPSLQDRSLVISWAGTPSVSPSEMARITGQASQQLRTTAGVRSVGVHIGRAITSDQVVGISSGEFWVTIDAKANYQSTVTRIQRVIDGYPGFSHRVLTYPEQKVSEAVAGTSGDVVVRVFGKELNILRDKAQEVRQMLSGIRGVVAPRVDLPPDEPTVEIEVNLAAAQRYGIKPGDVRRVTATLLSGLQAGSLFEDQKVFDVVVWGTPALRTSVDSVRQLLLDTPDGGHVRLQDVADVRINPNPTVIRHDDVSRRVDIAADVRGRSLGSVVSEIQQRLKGVAFPLEYHAELLGPGTASAAARAPVVGWVAAAAIAIFLLLQACFGSWRLASLLFLVLPVAPVGGVLIALASGVGISLGVVVGLFMVWALAARHGIQLIRHYQHLEQDEGERFGPDLVLRGTQERFAPILMSTLALGVALLPAVFYGNTAGLEVLRPLAIAVVGGLVTSILLSLFILPTLYLAFGAARRRGDQPTGRAERIDEPMSVRGPASVN
jgi:CzcA family heavy metal efflux pump